jgi:hypothetical protein
MRVLRVLLSGIGLATLLAWAPAASADVFGPISLASASAIPGYEYDQQADFANDAAISGDGRYVAFDGSFAGHSGVFRRDRHTGEVATVAEGDGVLPSISEDGRYVSFTTTARLEPADDTNEAPDVYVRDMSNSNNHVCESGEGAPPCAFTLASTVNGSPQGLSYEYGSNGAFEQIHYGSVASGRSALSADGRHVAFETTAVSNLANPGRDRSNGPEAPETPAAQVAVRDLDTETTTLVSVRYDPATGGAKVNSADQVEPTPAGEGGFGAVYPSGTQTPAFPSSYTGASISADGSTVTWMGQQISEQAPVMAGFDLATRPEYSEPLWRRIDEGQQVPTRRVTGGSDPTNPLCAASGELAVSQPPTLLDPCQGPFDPSSESGSEPGIWTGGTAEDYLPRLSANGMTVAFLSNAREIASGEELKAAEPSDDLYVVDMRDGLTRVEASRRLTELAGGSIANQARTAPIVDLGVSPDGSEIAFSTKRTTFPLGSPTYVSTPAAVLGAVELFDVDLANETLTRVTEGFEGQPSEASTAVASATGSPSFSDDGDLLALSSNSDNLVYGDGNKAGDAFVVSRLQFPSNPLAQEISPTPANPSTSPWWQLGATALSRRDGSVLLEVTVPGAGTLRVGAQSAVRVRTVVRARRAVGRRNRPTGRHGHPRTTVAISTVASMLAHPGTTGLLALALELGHRYRSLASARGGLSATVSLAFSAPGHPLLRQSIAVTFARTLPVLRHLPAGRVARKHSRISTVSAHR